MIFTKITVCGTLVATDAIIFCSLIVRLLDVPLQTKMALRVRSGEVSWRRDTQGRPDWKEDYVGHEHACEHSLTGGPLHRHHQLRDQSFMGCASMCWNICGKRPNWGIMRRVCCLSWFGGKRTPPKVLEPEPALLLRCVNWKNWLTFKNTIDCLHGTPAMISRNERNILNSQAASLHVTRKQRRRTVELESHW